MNKIGLNVIYLNSIVLNSFGSTSNKFTRYVPDDEIPNTHIDIYADTELFSALDGKFLVKH